MKIDTAKQENAVADLHATAAWASGQRWTCRCPEGCGPASRRWYEPENLGRPENVIRQPMVVRNPGRTGRVE